MNTCATNLFNTRENSLNNPVINTSRLAAVSNSMLGDDNAGDYLGILKALPLALLVTGGLVLFMERLIHMTDMVIDETPEVKILDPIWEEPVTQTNFDKAPPEKPKPIEQPPEAPTTIVELEPGQHYTVPMVDSDFTMEVETGISFGANMPIAQYLGAAKYPPQALRRGIEGYVDVMFDVTEYGSTDNIEVLEAMPEGIFETAAARAVASWRFRPKTVDEKPVRFEGMKKRVRFEMEK